VSKAAVGHDVSCLTGHEGGGLADGFRSLDLSFNNIRHPPHLPSLKCVKILYLIQNKISKVKEDDFDWCKDTITSLELGGNRIRVKRYRRCHCRADQKVLLGY
jgi:hypothetical protein